MIQPCGSGKRLFQLKSLKAIVIVRRYNWNLKSHNYTYFTGSYNKRNNLSPLYFKPSGGFWAALWQGPSPPMTSHHCVTMHSKINNGVLLCLNGIVSNQTNYCVIRIVQWIKQQKEQKSLMIIVYYFHLISFSFNEGRFDWV